MLGSARFPTAALSDGVTREVGGTASFAAPPPLWDQAGRRLALAGALASAPQARVPRAYNQRCGLGMENAFLHSGTVSGRLNMAGKPALSELLAPGARNPQDSL